MNNTNPYWRDNRGLSWASLSRYLPLEVIRRNIQLPWVRDSLSQNTNISLSDMRLLDRVRPSNPNHSNDRWNWDVLSLSVPLTDILDNPTEPWNYQRILERGDISNDQYMQFSQRIRPVFRPIRPYERMAIDELRSSGMAESSAVLLSQNPGTSSSSIRNAITPTRQQYISQRASLAYVRERPGYRWNRIGLSQNPEITLGDVNILNLPNAVGEWNYDYLSQYVSIEDVRNNPNERWNLSFLSRNPTLTAYDLENLILPNAVGSWSMFYMSKNINMDEIRANPHLLWDYEAVMENSGFTVNDGIVFLLDHIQQEREASVQEPETDLADY